jgi:hypothetical protein
MKPTETITDDKAGEHQIDAERLKCEEAVLRNQILAFRASDRLSRDTLHRRKVVKERSE